MNSIVNTTDAANSGAAVPIMLTELRLPTIKRLWADLAAQSNREGWPAERLLHTLLGHEMAERETRRLARARADSGLPPGKSLAEFDFAAVPAVSKAHVMALAEADSWISQGHNLLAFGPPGTGKTHLLAGIGHALIDRGLKVLFVRTSELVQRLQAARRDLRLPAELAKLDRFDLVVLDDFSYARRDQAETSVLFELSAERYERKSMRCTSSQRRPRPPTGPGRPGTAPASGQSPRHGRSSNGWRARARGIGCRHRVGSVSGALQERPAINAGRPRTSAPRMVSSGPQAQGQRHARFKDQGFKGR
jgi:DNA replication protein DnaC